MKITNKKYPMNLIQEIFKVYPYTLDLEIRKDIEEGKFDLSLDQIKWLEYVLSNIQPRKQEMIKLKFQENKTNIQIADEFGISRSRVGQIIHDELKKLGQKGRVEYFIKGYDTYNNEIEVEQKRIIAEKNKDIVPDDGIERLTLSVRAYNCLKTNGINVIRQLFELSYGDLMNMRVTGSVTVNEVEKELKRHGYSLRVDVD